MMKYDAPRRWYRFLDVPIDRGVWDKLNADLLVGERGLCGISEILTRTDTPYTLQYDDYQDLQEALQPYLEKKREKAPEKVRRLIRVRVQLNAILWAGSNA